MAARRNKPAKAKVVETLPGLGDAEIGEIYYDLTNGKIAIRTIAGWKQWTQD